MPMLALPWWERLRLLLLKQLLLKMAREPCCLHLKAYGYTAGHTVEKVLTSSLRLDSLAGG